MEFHEIFMFFLNAFLSIPRSWKKSGIVITSLVVTVFGTAEGFGFHILRTVPIGVCPLAVSLSHIEPAGKGGAPFLLFIKPTFVWDGPCGPQMDTRFGRKMYDGHRCRCS